MPAIRASLLALIALAILASSASAGLTLKYDGLHYARPHHWYTNDGRRHESSHHHSDDSPSASVLRDLVEHVAHKHHERSAECKHDQRLYRLRHGFTKPNSLREYTGCSLWRKDALYHSRIKDNPIARIIAWLTGA